MKTGKSDFPCAPSSSEYGKKMAGDPGSSTENRERSVESFWTKLIGNGIISTRLSRALGLKDPPGLPQFAKMSEVGIITDLMQGGFSAYSPVSEWPGVTGVVAVTPGLTDGAYFLFAAPGNNLNDPVRLKYFQGGAISALNTDPLVTNNAVDLRITNAHVSYFPQIINPSTDTVPESLHCRFFLDGAPVFEQVQNNLVASAADNQFVSQTADGFWNGIVPASSYFSMFFFKRNGLTGAFAPLDDLDGFEINLSALSVPAGTRLPGF